MKQILTALFDSLLCQPTHHIHFFGRRTEYVCAQPVLSFNSRSLHPFFSSFELLLYLGVPLWFTEGSRCQPGRLACPRGRLSNHTTRPNACFRTTIDHFSWLQPWITPSLFDKTGDSRIIDEWTFGQYQDKVKAAAALKTHWDTWITETDFRDIAAAG